MRSARRLLITSVSFLSTLQSAAYSHSFPRDDGISSGGVSGLAPARLPSLPQAWDQPPGFLRNSRPVLDDIRQQQQHDRRGNLRTAPPPTVSYFTFNNNEREQGGDVKPGVQEAHQIDEEADSTHAAVESQQEMYPSHRPQYYKSKKDDSDDDSSSDDSSDGYKNKHKKNTDRTLDNNIVSKISGHNSGNIFNFVRIDTLSIGARENDTTGATTSDMFDSNPNGWLGNGPGGGVPPVVGGTGVGPGLGGATGSGLGAPGAGAGSGANATTRARPPACFPWQRLHSHRLRPRAMHLLRLRAQYYRRP